VNNRLGFISTTGILGAIVVLAAVAAWTVFLGQGLFSPGALNSAATGKVLGGVRTHAEIGQKCGACHAAPWGTTTQAHLCLSCHADVDSQIQGHSGLHSGIVGKAVSPTCRGCHTEHHGPSGVLTVLDEATFPHDLTGYSLSRHTFQSNGARFTCVDCHGKDIAHFDQTVCADCHARMDSAFMAQHEKAFGKTCLACHNGSGKDGANFDHNQLPFKLTGKHAKVACDRCHTGVGASAKGPQFTPQECYSCHAKDDKHKGTFGTQCGQCHSTDGWGNAKFDHNIFPVNHGRRGGQQASCQTCHPTTLSEYTCYGCHEHTPAKVLAEHEGRAASTLTNCIRCHAGGRGEGGD
jgi:Class III cytochrome C family